MFENWVLKEICGPESAKVTGSWRKMYNEKFHDLFSFLNTQIIKLRTLRWVQHVACMGV